jgi:TolB-like protein/DNA-binding winged helix-turn-helix (wHTH) protein
MTDSRTASRTARFGAYEVEARSGEVRKLGTRIKLGEQPLRILLMLIDRAGEPVTREELRAELWSDDTFVDFERGLNSAVQRLRECLCDSAAKPRWIETIPRRGYRFIGQVQWFDKGIPSELLLNTEPEDEVQEPTAETDVLVREESSRKWRANLRVLRIGVVVVATAAVLLAAVPFIRQIRESAAARTRPIIRSLAVLPFENLSADPNQEYFSDGMTDELITRLAQNPELRVISRTSVMQYKKVHRPLADVARELGVDGILEGSVERSGNRIHLNAQLIYALHERHLWAESYDRDLNDLASLQSELARTIARQVGLTTAAVPRPERRISPEARDAYLMGRYYWFTSGSDEDIRKYLQKAIDLQPDYAAAWSGLADYYFQTAVFGDSRPIDAVPMGEAAARKGVMLDDSLPEAHNTMAAAYFCRWELKQAERESARAVELNPNFAEGHYFRGYILQALNQTNEAIEEQKKAMELDPFARPWALTYALIRAHQFDAALDEARLRSQAQPDNADLHEALSNAYHFKDMEKEAAREWETSFQLSRGKTFARAEQESFEKGGFRAVLEWQLSELKKKAAKQYVQPLDMAYVYASLERKDEALHYLEEAYNERAPFLVRIQSDPNFDFLHSEPRYQAVVKKMGLDPAW